ncbi:hypothetical protein BRADI_3g43363v3 [Brachypodium distachyon]|uniref:Endonuclease/exonuclease/phosphatase domain-containing protein n=1 Tax=Brachypodium distachyon TaxID=15368 RepID=A0A2K2D2X7_BRADI|nr:hypothetical protein BRADI_3g43363v3 [Brachypodium distachyon]
MWRRFSLCSAGILGSCHWPPRGKISVSDCLFIGKCCGRVHACKPEITCVNVRGIISLAKRAAISQVVSQCGVGLVCLQETKMQHISCLIVTECLGPNFTEFFFLSALGTHGGVLLAWNPSLVSLSNPHIIERAITALVVHDGKQWWCTGVYGPHSKEEQPAFRQEILILGDFDQIVNVEDKSNSRINRGAMGRFRRLLF